MKVIRYNLRSLFYFFLLFAAVATISAQTPMRIKVWHPALSASGTASQDGFRATPVQIQTSSSQAGYYIDVDTTTGVTQAPIAVTTNADTGAGSLRRAIETANTNPGLDHIYFNIGAGGPQTITVSKLGLPEITSPVVIDGTTQPGFAGNPMIELNGSQVWSFAVGLKIYSGNSTIRGLVLNRFQSNAIVLTTLGGNVLERNFIGTNMDGTDSLPNWGNGVVMDNSPNNRIGDSLSTGRNVISSNQYPNIAISGTGSIGNKVVGNYIGTDKDGLKDLYNYYAHSVGVLIEMGASNNVVGGLSLGERNVISGHGEGNVWLENSGTSNNVVQGNYIGTNYNASAQLYNGRGVVIIDGASDNLIGHTTLAGRNIISGGVEYFPGILVADPATTGNRVEGNIIGAPPATTFYFGNYDGVDIINAANNIIGGIQSGATNWISGNWRHGIVIAGSNASGNHIEGNLIGEPSIVGMQTLLSNMGSGIFIDDAPNNVIGGSDPLQKNTISANFQNGIVIRGDTATGNVVQGNFIGGQVEGVPGQSEHGNRGHGVLLLASHNTIGGHSPELGNIIPYNKGIGIYDSTGTNNLIRHNTIYRNDSMGIDLATRGITPNDVSDDDEGPNHLQNFPILDSASLTPSSIHIKGRLNSKPSTTYTLDFFSNEKRDDNFFGEGESWIGEKTVTTDAGGLAPIDATFLVAVPETHFITATATDPDSNTSEFSRGLCMQDMDGDGILDCWETRGEGIDWNADGKIDLDLFAHGARPDHKDVFVEVDYMFGFQPATTVLPMVQSAFTKVKNKYVNNPDHNYGINLIAELNPDDLPIPDSSWTTNWWKKFFETKKQFFGTDFERADSNAVNILEAKRLVYRYCIFAKRFGTEGSTGVAEGDGGYSVNDFMVTMGDWSGTTDLAQAGTFMHELGHTFGLLHGGGDTDNYKPNYYSIMNYTWQMPQDVLYYGSNGWKLDYSPVALPTLIEDSLNESVGLNPQPGDFPTVIVPFNSKGNLQRIGYLAPGDSIDWDGNGDSSGYASSTIDLNYLDHDPSNSPSPKSVLVGYADWPNLKYNFRSSPEFLDPPVSGPLAAAAFDTTIHHEMTPRIHDFLKTLPPYGIVKPLIEWPSDPHVNIPIATDAVEYTPLIAGDGEGGAFIAWNGGSFVRGIYAQKVDAFGALQWVNNGIPVAAGPENQGLNDFISDGSGNAIAVWVERRTGSFDIIAQKINRFGQRLWGTRGDTIVRVITTDLFSPWPRMKSDGQGGAIIVWTDIHLGTRSLFAQRIDASGSVLWAQGGVRVNTTPIYEASAFQIVSDGFSGVIVTWTDKRSGGVGDIYAQRVDASGLVRWTADGVPICDASGHQAEPALTDDGVGGAIVTWINYRSGGNDICAQHVDSTGQALWATNGIAVVSVAGAKFSLGIVTDSSHGAILSWLDERRVGGYRDAYAQRLNFAGGALWTANGIAISDTNLKCFESTIISDKNRGAIVILARQNIFQDNKLNIFAQLIDSTGTILWARNGIPVTLANTPVPFQAVSATSDLAGGAIITWQDGRTDIGGSGVRHIYAQNVTSSGGLGGGVTTAVDQTPTAMIPLVATLHQNYPNPFNPSTIIRYELPERSIVTLKIYNILGQEIATLVNGIQERGERQARFNANNLANGVYFYRLTTTGVGKNAVSIDVKKMILMR